MYTSYQSQQQNRSSYSAPVEETHEIPRSQGNHPTEPPPTTTYRSSVGPRVTNVQRSRPTGLGAAGVSTRFFQSHILSSTTTGFGPGLSSMAHYGVPMRGGTSSNIAVVTPVHTNRIRDKRDLELLNDKFAQYVEKVRFLEAQNRKLALELDVLKSRSGSGSSRIKEMYDIEWNEATKLVEDTNHDAAAAKAKAQLAEQELGRQKARHNEISGLLEVDRREIDAIQQEIAENEAQIALLRRRMADLEDESRRYKAETQRLASEIAHLQNEIQNELFLKSSCEVEKLALEDELANLKHMHEADLAELRSQSVSNDLDPSQFFRNELSEAIREVRNDYEAAIEAQRNELQNRHFLLTNEIFIRTQQPDTNPLFNEQQKRQVQNTRNELLQTRNQNSYLQAKNQEMQNSIAHLQQKIKDLQDRSVAERDKVERDIHDAQDHLRRINADYEQVIAFKTSLEKEIATYRHYLESPEGLRGCVDRIVQNAEQQAIDRPSISAGSAGGSLTSSTSITRTYINRTSPNYTSSSLYRNIGNESTKDSTTTANVTSSQNQPPSSSNLYQTLSSTYRSSPLSDGTNRNSNVEDERYQRPDLNRNTSTSDDRYQRQNSNRNSNLVEEQYQRQNSNRNSSIVDERYQQQNSNRPNIVRSTTIPDETYQNLNLRPNSSREETPRSSVIRENVPAREYTTRDSIHGTPTAVRGNTVTFRNNLSRESSVNDNRHSADYESLSNT